MNKATRATVDTSKVPITGIQPIPNFLNNENNVDYCLFEGRDFGFVPSMSCTNQPISISPHGKYRVGSNQLQFPQIDIEKESDPDQIQNGRKPSMALLNTLSAVSGASHVCNDEQPVNEDMNLVGKVTDGEVISFPEYGITNKTNLSFDFNRSQCNITTIWGNIRKIFVRSTQQRITECLSA